MAATLVEFIRWARDRVRENPEVTHYTPMCEECGMRFAGFSLLERGNTIRLEPDYGDGDADELLDNEDEEPNEG